MNLDVILRERLAILGGTGSGKSYAARGLAERILARGDRLGVYIGAIAAFGIIENGSRGHVRAAGWLFP